MCGPLLTYYGEQQKAKAYKTVQEAQAKAQMEANNHALALQKREQVRQHSLQDQSQAMLQQSTGNNSVESQNAQEAQMRQELNDQYAAAAQALTNPAGIPGLQQASEKESTPTVVADAYKKMFDSVGGYLKQQAGSKAALDAFGNSQQATGIANARQLQQQGLLGNFMHGSSSALANELASNSENGQLAQMYAARAGDKLAARGALWSGLGQLEMQAAAGAAGR